MMQTLAQFTAQHPIRNTDPIGLSSIRSRRRGVPNFSQYTESNRKLLNEYKEQIKTRKQEASRPQKKAKVKCGSQARRPVQNSAQVNLARQQVRSIN